MRNRRLDRCLIYPILLLATVPGCQVFHAYRPVTVQARDAETKQPIPGAEIRLSYPLVRPSDGPWQSVGTTGGDGTTQLRAAPYGEAGIMLDVTKPGYMSEQKNYPTEAVKAIESSWFIKPAGPPTVNFVVEMYAEPFPSVELVLPNGYRGTVKVGVKIQEDVPCPAGQRLFSYQVPPSGILQITGPPLLRRVFSPDFSARYVDGTVLNRQPQGDEVGFLCLKTEGGFDYYVVGTRAEFEALRHAEQTEGSGQNKSSGSGKGGGKGKRSRNGGSSPPASDPGQSDMAP
jgi:hypothetical protein